MSVRNLQCSGRESPQYSISASKPAARWTATSRKSDTHHQHSASQRLVALLAVAPCLSRRPLQKRDVNLVKTTALLQDQLTEVESAGDHTTTSSITAPLNAFAERLRASPEASMLLKFSPKARAWLLERAYRLASLGDETWMDDWDLLLQKIILRYPGAFETRHERDDMASDAEDTPEDDGFLDELLQSWDMGSGVVGMAASFLAVRLATSNHQLQEEELSALAWSIEVLKLRDEDRVRSVVELLIEEIRTEEDGEGFVEMIEADKELDSQLPSHFQDTVSASTPLMQVFQLSDGFDDFDEFLFRLLFLAFRREVDIRKCFGGGGVRRPGSSSSGSNSLVATRAARLARSLANISPLASDDDFEVQDKLQAIRSREEEILEDVTSPPRTTIQFQPKLNLLEDDDDDYEPFNQAQDVKPAVVSYGRPDVSSLLTYRAADPPPPGAKWAVPGSSPLPVRQAPADSKPSANPLSEDMPPSPKPKQQAKAKLQPKQKQKQLLQDQPTQRNKQNNNKYEDKNSKIGANNQAPTNKKQNEVVEKRQAGSNNNKQAKSERSKKERQTQDKLPPKDTKEELKRRLEDFYKTKPKAEAKSKARPSKKDLLLKAQLEANFDDIWEAVEGSRDLAWEEQELKAASVKDEEWLREVQAAASEAWAAAEALDGFAEDIDDEDDDEVLRVPDPPPPRSEPLPIEAFRDEILSRVRSQRVTIVIGETGCGKSTKLPQYLADEPNARVLVTQPRRVAAVEIARRIASERGEALGETVGYRIGGETLLGTGQLQFATIGYALAWFLGRPESFARFTHIVLDEVHERGSDMELFLLLTKLLMQFFKGPKVVLMSATMQAEVFNEYYAEFSDGSLPLTIPGRTFPVSEVFLDDLFDEELAWKNLMPAEAIKAAMDATEVFKKSTAPPEEPVEEAEELTESKIDTLRPSIMTGLPELALKLIPVLGRANSTLLVFLPGLVEINSLANLFDVELEAMDTSTSSTHDSATRYKVFILHSLVPPSEQAAVFKEPTGGTCNVVLASNIAESSLTLPNVTAVIDFGLHREPVFDSKQNLSRLVTTWCSHASARQRSGRAGRTQPGIAVRLFTRDFFKEKMPQFDTPEILRSSLAKLYLRAKKLCKVLKKLSLRRAVALPFNVSSARALLSYLPQPPDTTLLNSAVKELASVGAIAAADELAEVTALGLFAQGLPLELGLCRLIWLGALWGCAVEAVVMAAACSSSDPFTAPTREMFSNDSDYVTNLRRSWFARKHFDGGYYSQPLMLLRLFCYWIARFQTVSVKIVESTEGGKKRRHFSPNQAWSSATHSMVNEVEINPSRMQKFIANVADLAERVVRLPLPGGPETARTATRDLNGLLHLLKLGQDVTNVTPQSDLFRAKVPLIQMLLAASFSDQLMVGRRFIDQLRGPTKGQSEVAPTVASPRRNQNGEDEGEDEVSSTKISEEDSADDGDLETDVDSIDGEDDKGVSSEENEAQRLSATAAEMETDVDKNGNPKEKTSKLPWKQARDAMFDAVNALPIGGPKTWQRVLVSRLEGLQKEKPVPGALAFADIPSVMKMMCGKPPLYISRKEKTSAFASVCFPPEPPNELSVKGSCAIGPPEADAPVIIGASSDTTICHMFSAGSPLFELEGQVVARPTSPYLLTFFLPERGNDSDEENQKSIRASLDIRSPVGFPCHVYPGADFFCTASDLQLSSSRTSVRADGSSIFPAAHIAFALVSLCPEKSSVLFSLKMGSGKRGRTADRQITAVKVGGWELTLGNDGLSGLPAAPLLEALSDVRSNLREALCGNSHDLASWEEDGTFRLDSQSAPLGKLASVKAVDKLLDIVDSATKKLKAVAQQKKGKQKETEETTWLQAEFMDEESSSVDFLRRFTLSELK